MKYEANVAICKSLGLDPMRVKSILIRLSPLDAPRITVEYIGCAQVLEGVLKDYRVEPIQPSISAEQWRDGIGAKARPLT